MRLPSRRDSGRLHVPEALPAAAVPPELGYGKLQVQEIPPVRALLRRGARCRG